MDKIYIASQTVPYELLNKKIKLPRESARLHSLAGIVLLTHPNYNEKDIEKMFKGLYKCGCTYATYTNAIIEQLKKDNDIVSFLEEFQTLFGYSLYDPEKNYIDYNRLLVDLYSTLYKMGNLSASWYKKYSYKSMKAAAVNLGILKENEDYEENLLYNKLFDNGYSGEGFDEDGNLIFKERIPKVVIHAGTYQELAQKVLNGDFSNLSDEKVKELLKNNNIQVREEFCEEYSKLSGLTTKNINFWLNEFFRRKKIDLHIDVQNMFWGVGTSNELLQKINDTLDFGASISVSWNHKQPIHMKKLKEKYFSWTKLENDRFGHAMFLKGISEEGDLIVSSWGDDYLIPIDYCNELELNSIVVKKKYNYDLENQGKSNIAK